MANVPVGVKIISVLYYIGAALSVLGGLGVIIGGSIIGDALSQMIPFGMALGGIAIVVGIFLIALGVLDFFIGMGLWKGQSWARIVAIVLAAVGLLMAIIGMAGGNITGNILGLLFNGIVGGYLLLSKPVQAAFA